MTIAVKLKEAREKCGKTQKEVAESVGIQQSTLANYETGMRVPRDQIKERLAACYGMTVQELFFN